MGMAALAAAMLCSCASGALSGAPASKPEPGCQQQLVDRLYFGLMTPDGELPEAQWQRFVQEEITPRFPDGLTVLQGMGQWRGGDGKVLREPSRIVEIVHPDAPQARQAVREIIDRYKTRHQQESVLLLRRSELACF